MKFTVALTTAMMWLVLFVSHGGAACSPGHVGEPVPVSVPAGTYWTASGTLTVDGEKAADVSRYNYQPVPGGPCVAGLTVDPAIPTFGCPGGAGPVGPRGSVTAPSGAHWTNPTTLGNGIEVQQGSLIEYQRENRQAVPAGPCLALVAVQAGEWDGRCPNESSWWLGNVGFPTPEGGIYFDEEGEHLYVGGTQRQVVIHAANREVGGRCMPAVTTAFAPEFAWERCISCPP